ILKSIVSEAFLKAGGRANALDFMVAKAQAALTVENGAVVGKVFDPDKPGEKLTVEGFIALQIRESDYAFHPSNGGGSPSRTGGGRPPAANQLVDPTPQQLGEHASAIKAGTLKVVYTNS